MKDVIGFSRTRNLSIKYKIILTVIIIILIPFLLLVSFYTFYIQDILKDKMIYNHKEITKQVGQNINVILKDMVTTTKLINTNKDMNEVLSNNIYDDPVNVFSNIKMINNFFTDIQYSVLSYPNSFAVLEDQYANIHVSQGFVISGLKDVMKDFLDKNIPEKETLDEMWIGPVANELIKKSSTEYFITLLKKTNYVNYGRHSGIIAVCVDEANFYEILKSNNSNSSINTYIVDDTNKIISSTDRASLGKYDQSFKDLQLEEHEKIAFFDNQKSKKIINIFRLDNQNWSVVEVIPYSVIYKDVERAKLLFVLLGGVFLFIFISVSVSVLSRLMKPMLELAKAMKKVQGGDLNVSVKPRSMDEVGQLSINFNHMVLTMNQLIETISQEQRIKREAELKMLRAQIKPHFLFNTLNTIRWVAEINQAKPVSELIVALSMLLKNSILANKEFITVGEEIENLKNYCIIQKARYGGIFEIDFTIDEETLRCQIPNLILQPIVENSLLHGFQGMGGTGIIKVESHRDGSDLLIKVQDNGRGVDSGKIAQVFQGENKKDFGGIGILNVHERLKINYGSHYGIRMHSESGEGTTTIINIPMNVCEESIEA